MFYAAWMKDVSQTLFTPSRNFYKQNYRKITPPPYLTLHFCSSLSSIFFHYPPHRYLWTGSQGEVESFRKIIWFRLSYTWTGRDGGGRTQQGNSGEQPRQSHRDWLAKGRWSIVRSPAGNRTGMKGQMGGETFKHLTVPSYFTGYVDNHVR